MLSRPRQRKALARPARNPRRPSRTACSCPRPLGRHGSCRVRFARAVSHCTAQPLAGAEKGSADVAPKGAKSPRSAGKEPKTPLKDSVQLPKAVGKAWILPCAVCACRLTLCSAAHWSREGERGQTYQQGNRSEKPSSVNQGAKDTAQGYCAVPQARQQPLTGKSSSCICMA